jgi:hypothetical protein
MAGGSARSDDFEHGPRRQSIGRQPLMRDRHLGDDDLLESWERMRKLKNPLIRFIRNQVGRLWRDIEPELIARCKKIRADGSTQRKVRKELLQMVLNDKKLPVARIGRFFVDPRTGVLCHMPFRKAATPAPVVVRHPQHKLKQFHCVAGVWHEVSLVRYRTWADLYRMKKDVSRSGDSPPREVLWELQDRGPVKWHRWQIHRGSRSTLPASLIKDLARVYGRKWVFADAMRKLTKQEIRKFGLTHEHGAI